VRTTRFHIWSGTKEGSTGGLEFLSATPLMTLTTDLGLYIRVSMFEYVGLVTGTSSGRAASGGVLAPQPLRATRSQPESIPNFWRTPFSPTNRIESVDGREPALIKRTSLIFTETGSCGILKKSRYPHL